MKRWVICAVFSLLMLEAVGSEIVIGASGDGRQNAYIKRSSGSLPARR